MLDGILKGAAYALGFATQYPDLLKGLIVCDFPARYKKFTSIWLERSLANPNVKPHVTRGLFHETEEVTLWDELENIRCPVLVLRGGKEGSFLSAEEAEIYKSKLQNVEVVVFEESGHSLWEPDQEKFIKIIHKFLNQLDH
ncbi:MAG: alpha/beta hydrolase [Paenibacillaceae bacterium]